MKGRKGEEEKIRGGWEQEGGEMVGGGDRGRDDLKST